MTQARFIARSAAGFEDAAKIFSDLFKKRLTSTEQLQLIAMLCDIARLDGASPAQDEAIEGLRQRLGLASAHCVV